MCRYKHLFSPKQIMDRTLRGIPVVWPLTLVPKVLICKPSQYELRSTKTMSGSNMLSWLYSCAFVMAKVIYWYNIFGYIADQ